MPKLNWKLNHVNSLHGVFTPRCSDLGGGDIFLNNKKVIYISFPDCCGHMRNNVYNTAMKLIICKFVGGGGGIQGTKQIYSHTPPMKSYLCNRKIYFCSKTLQCKYQRPSIGIIFENGVISFCAMHRRGSIFLLHSLPYSRSQNKVPV